MKSIIRIQAVELKNRPAVLLLPVRRVAAAIHPRNASYLKNLKPANDEHGGPLNVA